MKQGAFARYFDQKKLGMYLMKKLHFSAGEDILLPLAGLCMDAAVAVSYTHLVQGCPEPRGNRGWRSK